MVCNDEDVLAQIYRFAREGVPLHVVRHRVGGDRVYLAVRPRLTTEQRAAVVRDSETMGADLAAKRHGISRRHVYRIKCSIANGARGKRKGRF